MNSAGRKWTGIRLLWVSVATTTAVEGVWGGFTPSMWAVLVMGTLGAFGAYDWVSDRLTQATIHHLRWKAARMYPDDPIAGIAEFDYVSALSFRESRELVRWFREHPDPSRDEFAAAPSVVKGWVRAVAAPPER